MRRRVRRRPRQPPAEQQPPPQPEDPPPKDPPPKHTLADGYPSDGNRRRWPKSLTKDVRTGELREVLKTEKLQRRQLVSALLVNGTDIATVKAVCADKFGMTKQATVRVVRKVYDSWAKHDEQQRPQHKRAAQRRIHGHIQQAKKLGKMSAVASLETLLARIQGTMEPIEVNVQLEATVRESVLHVLATTDAARMSELAERALAYRGHAPPRQLPAPEGEGNPGLLPPPDPPPLDGGSTGDADDPPAPYPGGSRTPEDRS